jgi:ABC-2 type transport system ATP-binding protein/lipopolysaccharide transport system ATP-binding protein
VSDAAISLDRVSKSFWLAQERRTSLKERVVKGRGRQGRVFWALKDATFDIPHGTTFGLVGHNGSGKSTALKVIAGIYRPTSGEVMVDGRLAALLELGAGFHGELSGRENVRLNGSILGMSRRQIDDAMDEIIEFSGIGDFIDSPVKVYSSGMFVRLGFAIAVTVQPEILVIDEVIAVGDEEFQRKCFDHLYSLRARGTTIVLVSHSLGLVEDLCENAVWLDHGEVRQLGPARDVVRQYVESVNRSEAAQSGSAPTAAAEVVEEAPLSPTRHGSGDVRIDRIELLDGDGAASSFLVAGEDSIVRMHYRCTRPIERCVFGLAFVHETGARVAGPNSGRQGAWSLPAGGGHVDFVVTRLPLQPGTFAISVAAVDRGHIFDYMDNHTTMRVRGSGSDEPGLTRIDGTWSFEADATATARSGGTP